MDSHKLTEALLTGTRVGEHEVEGSKQGFLAVWYIQHLKNCLDLIWGMMDLGNLFVQITFTSAVKFLFNPMCVSLPPALLFIHICQFLVTSHSPEQHSKTRKNGYDRVHCHNLLSDFG